MVQQAEDHDRVHLVVHLVVDGDVRSGFAVALAEMAGEFHPRREGLGREVILDDLNVPIVPP